MTIIGYLLEFFLSFTHRLMDRPRLLIGLLVGNMLSTKVTAFGKWDYVLPKIEFEYNKSTNRSTGFSPFLIVYITNPRGPLGLNDNPLFDVIPHLLLLSGLIVYLLFMMKHVLICNCIIRYMKSLLILISETSFSAWGFGLGLYF